MRDSNGNILKETDSAQGTATPYYYLTDALGTPWKMLDTSGAVAWSAAYKAFGEAAVSYAANR